MKTITFLFFFTIFLNPSGYIWAAKIDSLKIEIERHQGDDEELTWLYNDLARQLYFENNFDASLTAYESAMEFAEKAKNYDVNAEAKSMIGLLYRRKGDLDIALKFHRAAVALGEKGLIKSHRYVRHLGTLAVTYRYLGQPDENMKCLLKAIKIAEESRDTANQIYTYYNLGTFHFYQNNGEACIDYYQKSLELALETNAVRDIGYAYSGLGAIYGNLEVYDSAAYYLRLSYQLSKEQNDQYSQAVSLMNLSEIYEAAGDYQLAFDALQEALSIQREHDTGLVESTILETLAGLYVNSLKQPQKGIETYLAAYELIREEQLPKEKLIIFEGLSTGYKSIGNFKAVVPYQDSIKHYQQVIFEEEKIKTAADLEAKYESGKKELEIANQKIAILQKENQLKQTYLWGGGILLLLLIAIFWNTRKRYRLQKQMNQTLASVSQKIRESTAQIQNQEPTTIENLAQHSQQFLDTYQQDLSATTVLKVQDIESDLKQLQSVLSHFSQKVVQQISQEQQHTIEDLQAFNYSISHDLRTPLNRIKGFIQLLMEVEDQHLDERVRQYLQIISRAVYRMEELMDKLLHYARIEQSQVHFYETNTHALVQEVLSELSISQKVEINLGRMPTINTDPILLRQVFTNLISNALKFSKHEENPTIDISTQFKEESVVFRVKDNGIGFQAQQEKRIFELFQRLHSEQEYEGTGAGLTIVKRIIQKLGGDIWAEGKPGIGATFYIDLPRLMYHSKSV